MSDTPKKKPAKSTPAKKQAQKKPAASKSSTTGARKPGRPKKVVEPTTTTVAKDVEEFLDELERVVAEEAQEVANDVVIHATSVKKESLRKRMLKWFK